MDKGTHDEKFEILKKKRWVRGSIRSSEQKALFQNKMFIFS
jgi:hypothetical protein